MSENIAKVPRLAMKKRDIALWAVALLYASWSQIALAEYNARPEVVLNANFAGCIKPKITAYSVDNKHVDASLKIIRDTGFSEGPCVCRGGSYYFQVFPSDTALPPGRAWMYAKSVYKADLAFGVLPSKPYAIPHAERIRFPSFRNRMGRPLPGITWR